MMVLVPRLRSMMMLLSLPPEAQVFGWRGSCRWRVHAIATAARLRRENRIDSAGVDGQPVNSARNGVQLSTGQWDGRDFVED